MVGRGVGLYENKMDLSFIQHQKTGSRLSHFVTMNASDGHVQIILTASIKANTVIVTKTDHTHTHAHLVDCLKNSQGRSQ